MQVDTPHLAPPTALVEVSNFVVGSKKMAEEALTAQTQLLKRAMGRQEPVMLRGALQMQAPGGDESRHFWGACRGGGAMSEGPHPPTLPHHTPPHPLQAPGLPPAVPRYPTHCRLLQALGHAAAGPLERGPGQLRV